MSSIMRRRSGLTPSFVIAKAPVCCVDDSQTQPDKQVASLHKPSAPISTGINAAIHGLYRASGSVQSALARVKRLYTFPPGSLPRLIATTVFLSFSMQPSRAPAAPAHHVFGVGFHSDRATSIGR